MSALNILRMNEFVTSSSIVLTSQITSRIEYFIPSDSIVVVDTQFDKKSNLIGRP